MGSMNPWHANGGAWLLRDIYLRNAALILWRDGCCRFNSKPQARKALADFPAKCLNHGRKSGRAKTVRRLGKQARSHSSLRRIQPWRKDV
jgi:hypothetical protein